MAKKVNLPDFWDDSPELWFSRAEAEFDLKGISVDATRYSYLVSKLPKEVANRVHDELVARDATKTPYASLKKRLLKVFTLSKHQRGEQIIDMPPSHAERPSVVMDRMLQLLPSGVSRDDPGFLFRTLFLRKLPADIRILLAEKDDLSPRELAEAADQYWQSRPPAAVAAVLLPPAEFDDEPVAAVSGRASRYTCFFHEKYGAKAARCRSPCSWKDRQALKGRGKKN